MKSTYLVIFLALIAICSLITCALLYTCNATIYSDATIERNPLNNLQDVSNTQYKEKFVESNDYVSLKLLRQNLGLDFANNTASNATIAVAILDTGTFPHLDLVSETNRIIAFKDFVNFKEEPYDDNGHGTAIAGIIAGNGVQSDGKYEGISPGINIVSVKVLNYRANGSIENLISGIEWIIENKDIYNIKIMNISIGVQTMEYDALARIADAAFRLGIVVVTSSGNAYPGEQYVMYSPAISNDVISVGSLRGNEISDFTAEWISPTSQLKPDIFVVGEEIISLDSDIYYTSDYQLNNHKVFYKDAAGTSMSAAVVSGLLANMILNDPDATPDELRMRLLSKCNVYGSKYFLE